ncbi:MULTISPECIES: hypothetical protein [Rhodococcus]|uniref:hypothetical protein n=1 Tax=Rhodococcus TaxID=1827 RepID=UPI000C7A2928|nr:MULTISPECIES: hypothetical protein [Rhodococcus]AUM16443.1 hypothetical protein CSW53_07845 [Rhodococcus ruber]
MAYRGLLFYGDTELINSRRTVAHILNGVRPLSLEVRHDDSWPHTARLLAHAPYVMPDEAPWHTPGDPDSLEFAGVWPMSVDGLDTSTLSREIVEGLGDGATTGVTRFGSKQITITALLVASSAAGAEFGLRWLTERLADASDVGAGTSLRFLSAAPELDPDLTGVATRAAMAGRWRTLYQVVTTAPPTVTGRFGFTRGQDTQASVFAVSWTMTALIPHVFHDPVVAIADSSLTGISTSTPTWTVAVDGECDGGCTDTGAAVLVDPEAAAAARVVRELTTVGSSGVCVPLESKRIAQAVPADPGRAARPDVVRVAVTTGAQVARGLRLQIVPGTGIEAWELAERCGALTEIGISYIPAGSTLTLDGATGTAWCDTPEGRMDAAAVVRGSGGAPWRFPLLDDIGSYGVLLDTPASLTELTVDAWTIARES